jgi:deoxyadenosine/deoxycytidine kinase
MKGCALLALPHIDAFMNKTRVEICGGIGVGKTTLARRLAGYIPETVLIREDFRANPIWHRYYLDPTTYFKEKNISFLAQHFAEIKAATTRAICDFSPLQDLAYAALVGDEEHECLMKAIYLHLARTVAPPTLVLHLTTTIDKQLAQIAERGRREEQALSQSNLQALNLALDNVLAERARDLSIQTLDVTGMDLRVEKDLFSEISAMVNSRQTWSPEANGCESPNKW